METPKEMRAKIVDKATGDADFRARLLSDPKGALEQELSVTISGVAVGRGSRRERHERASGSSPRQPAERKRPASGRRRRSSPRTGVGPPHLVIPPGRSAVLRARIDGVEPVFPRVRLPSWAPGVPDRRLMSVAPPGTVLAELGWLMPLPLVPGTTHGKPGLTPDRLSSRVSSPLEAWQHDMDYTTSPERSEPDGNTEGNAGEDRGQGDRGRRISRARLLSDPRRECSSRS